MSRILVISLLISTAISGCNSGLLESKEEACLKSDMLNFKDPTSLKVISNLGQRGFQASIGDEQSFWIRYISKNGFGANISSNMACKKTSAGIVRDKELEQLAIQATSQKRAEALLAQITTFTESVKSCKDRDCALSLARDFPHAGKNTMQLKVEVEKGARDAVLESPDNILTH